MKIFFNHRILAISCFVVFAFISCEKVATSEAIGSAGQTFVKFNSGATPGAFEKKSIPFVNTPSIIDIDLQRLIPSASELNKKMIVIIKDDTAAVSFYNRDTVSTNPDRTNPDNQFLIKMPDNWYSGGTNSPKTGGDGGNYTLTFNEGEFAKALQIVVADATLMDPSSSYGLAFTITSVDANGKISDKKTIVVGIGAKNIVHEDLKWDFFRWNLTTQASTEPTIVRNSGFDGDAATLTTITGNAIEVPSGYFIQPRYRLTFTNAGGVAKDFVLTVNPDDEADLVAAGITYTNRPVILEADFAAKKYKFSYQVFNGTAYRYIVDYYHP